MVPKCFPSGEMIQNAAVRGRVQVTLLVGLHAVRGGLDEDPAAGDAVVLVDVVRQDLPAAADVERALVGRQGDAVRAAAPRVPLHQRELPVLDAVDAGMEQLARGAVAPVAHAGRHVGEEDGAARARHEIVRAVQPLAVEAVGQHRARAVRLDAHHRPVGHRGDQQASLRIERQPVRADEQDVAAPAGRLRAGIHDVVARIAGLLHEEGELAIGRPLVDGVGRDVAEQQMPALGIVDPQRPLGHAEMPSEQLEARAGTENGVDGRIVPLDPARVLLRLAPGRRETRHQDGDRQPHLHPALQSPPRPNRGG